TAIVANVEGQGLPFAGHDESVTQTFEVLQDFAGVKILDPTRGDTINKPSSKPPPVKDRTEGKERESGIPTVRPPAAGPVEPAKSGGMAWVIVLMAIALAAAGYWFFGR
ncbi:MAG: hypothetical protein CVU63_10640, partial [Deltaproteobacteria bacterium HGW-Deltaproteobacteria-20]